MLSLSLKVSIIFHFISFFFYSPMTKLTRYLIIVMTSVLTCIMYSNTTSISNPRIPDELKITGEINLDLTAIQMLEFHLDRLHLYSI